MWFWLAVTALLFWSGSDLFSKIGCRDNDKYAHLKMVIAVGVIMGIHALYEILQAERWSPGTCSLPICRFPCFIFLP